MRLFDEPLLKSLIPGDVGGDDRIEALFDRLRASTGPVETALAVDRRTYLPDDLLAKVDHCSMLHALEVRSPFMDHDLLNFAAGLKADDLLRGGPKRMFRLAFAADLPPSVFKRRKMGFAVPVGQWLRTSLRPMLNDLLFSSGSFAADYFNRPVLEALVNDHQQRRQDHSQRLYCLLMLELWARQANPQSHSR